MNILDVLTIYSIILFQSMSMFDSNSSKISVFRFKMSLAWVFPILNFLANSRHPLPLAAEFIRSTLSFKDNAFLFDAISYSKSTQFSIPNTPGHLNTLCYYSEYLSVDIGISKQSLSTCMHTCRLNWPINDLSVTVIRIQVNFNWLMIMFAKQTNTFYCPLEPGFF